MSINFYVGEVQAQSSSAVAVANAYIQHAGTLKDSVNAMLSAPLSGETYKSAKAYFMAVYPPISSALILVGESMVEAHTKFPEKFQTMVDSCDVEEHRLKAQIEQGQNLLKAYAEVLNKEEKPNQRMEQAYMRMQEGVGKLEEKLADLYAFNGESAGIFAEVEANLDNLEQGLSAIENCTAWNPSSGTFDISKLNLSWTKPINEAWQKREERKEQAIQQRLARLNAYEIECVEYGGKYGKSWAIIKDGQRLSKKDHPELYALLEEYGNHLAKDQYTVKKLKIVKNEVTYVPGFGLGNVFGKIGAVDKLVKGLGALKIGTQTLEQIKSAPSFAKVREVEPDDMIPQQGLVTSDSNKANNVDAGKQGKHQEGHKNNVQSKEKKSTWIDGTNGVAETQEAWEKGSWVEGREGTVKEYDAGRVIGNDGETTQIIVHGDKKGNLHGYPNIPPKSRR